jgi:hypothetical protein
MRNSIVSPAKPGRPEFLASFRVAVIPLFTCLLSVPAAASSFSLAISPSYLGLPITVDGVSYEAEAGAVYTFTCAAGNRLLLLWHLKQVPRIVFVGGGSPKRSEWPRSGRAGLGPKS